MPTAPIHVPVLQRYLVPFDPRRIPHQFTDVLVIGGGIAGIRAALAVDPALQTIIVTKDRLQQSNSTYAQGGIAGVLDPLDDFANHVADTIAAGKGDIYARFGPTCEWDTAAGDAILRSSGGLITDMKGMPLVYGGENAEWLNPEFVAASFEWYADEDA